MFSPSDNYHGKAMPDATGSGGFDNVYFNTVGSDEESDASSFDMPVLGIPVPELPPIDVKSNEWTHQEPDDPNSPSNFGLPSITHSPIVSTGKPFGFFGQGLEAKASFNFEEFPAPTAVHPPKVRMAPSTLHSETKQGALLVTKVPKKNPPHELNKKAAVKSGHDEDVQAGLGKRRPRQIWTKAEDDFLLHLLKSSISEATKKGADMADLPTNWSKVADKMNTNRTAKQCRDRWQNYLRPGIKKGDWTEEEEQQIESLHQQIGGRWSKMAQLLRHRSENDIKNKWYSMKRVAQRARRNKKRGVAKLGNGMQSMSTGKALAVMGGNFGEAHSIFRGTKRGPMDLKTDPSKKPFSFGDPMDSEEDLKPPAFELGAPSLDWSDN